MSELLPQLLARRGYNRLLAHDQLQDAWEAAAGRLHSLYMQNGCCAHQFDQVERIIAKLEERGL